MTNIAQAQTLTGVVSGLGDALGESPVDSLLGGGLAGLTDISLVVDNLLLGGEQGGGSAALANEILLLGAPADSPLEGENQLLKNNKTAPKEAKDTDVILRINPIL
jgi:hypothetical protein